MSAAFVSGTFLKGNQCELTEVELEKMHVPLSVSALASGGMCPFRHISGEKTVVCKHWLRGLCKKGDQCEFLHEYDMTKMPECYFYSKFGPHPSASTP